ncbi:hypothetical protein Hanom_Chr17g01524291 [Helianthus anomalus]
MPDEFPATVDVEDDDVLVWVFTVRVKLFLGQIMVSANVGFGSVNHGSRFGFGFASGSCSVRMSSQQVRFRVGQQTRFGSDYEAVQLVGRKGFV